MSWKGRGSNAAKADIEVPEGLKIEGLRTGRSPNGWCSSSDPPTGMSAPALAQYVDKPLKYVWDNELGALMSWQWHDSSLSSRRFSTFLLTTS